MTTSPTFDAHIHLWQRPHADLPVATQRNGHRDQLNMTLALMDRHGVKRACVVAACIENEADNHEFVADVTTKHPDRFIMFSEIPLTAPNRDELLDQTIHKWPARGFRYCVDHEDRPDEWTGGLLDDFWQRASDAGLCVCFNHGPRHIALLGPLVERWPKINWIIDHMGEPQHDKSDAAYAPVLDLARLPNVFVKISGFYAYTADPAEYPYADLFRFVTWLRNAYGARRLMWGSDIPPALEDSTYAQTRQCVTHISQLSESDLEWILGGTADELFKSACQAPSGVHGQLTL